MTLHRQPGGRGDRLNPTEGDVPERPATPWPGAFVQVTLNLTTDADALVVPATAVQASQDGQYVYVVKSDQTVNCAR